MSVELLHYTRGKYVENIHRGDVVAVNARGEVVGAVGNADLPMFWRSAAKPFQALAFVKDGGMEKYNITEEELAFLCSSHSGEAMHVDLVQGVLAKISLSISDLACGAMKPMSSKAAKEVMLRGEKFSVVHNSCSGKHSQILALAQMLGVATEGYTEPSHAAQKVILSHVAMATKMAETDLDIGIDGCGVPVFYLPLSKMAFAYARLGSPDKGDWGAYEGAARRIRDAMLAYPKAVSGTGRVDLAVTEITKGRILAKIGSDAVYCLTARDGDIGIAFKVENGSFAAVNPTVIGALKHFDLLTKEEAAELDAKYPPILKNHRGDIIGRIETVF